MSFRLSVMRDLPRISIAAAAAACVALSACTDNGTSSGNASLQIQMTDAPFPFSSVSRVDVFVVRVDAKKAESSESEASSGVSGDNSNENPDQGWVTVATPNQRYNLLELRNGTTVNLGQHSLPVGTYRGFRLILNTDSTSVTLTNGTVLRGTGSPNIQFPSAGRTGIKVKLEEPITIGASGNNSSIMVLDFDLANSFVVRGNSITQNGLTFKPVIRAIARDISGTISGTVRSTTATGAVVSGATVEVLKNGTTLADTVSANVVATTSSDASGNFTLAFLKPDTYMLRGILGDKRAILGPLTVTQSQTVSGQVVVLP